jgi:DNA polymerase-3 subunit epsilon
MADAAAAQRYERAAVLLRRRDRLAALVGRLSGLLEATHARSRLVLARHPAKDRWDAFWVVAGTVADWGPLPGVDELAERTSAALAGRPQRRRATTPDQVDEIRIVHTWIAAHDPPRLELDEPPTSDQLADWLRSVCPGGATGRDPETDNGGKSWESWTR